MVLAALLPHAPEAAHSQGEKELSAERCSVGVWTAVRSHLSTALSLLETSHQQ